MRKQYVLIAAASMTVAGFGMTSWAESPQQTGQGQIQPSGGMQGQQQTRVNLPAGVERKDASVENIRETLSDVTETCLSKNKDYDNIVDYFVSADRDRLKDFSNKAMDNQLAGRIEQIRQTWQQKYNKDLNVDGKVAFGEQFRGLEIVRGEIVNPALLSNWPVQNQAGGQQMQPGQPGMQQGQQQQWGQGQQKHLDKGREVAIVTFPASHGLPECNVSLVREGMGWKLDIPDNITGDQLQQNLSTHLTRFGEMSAQWGSDANETSRLAAHHVCLALYGIPSQGGAQQSGYQGGQKQDQNLQQDQSQDDMNVNEETDDSTVEQD